MRQVHLWMSRSPTRRIQGDGLASDAPSSVGATLPRVELDDARSFALSLPEAVEAPHHDMSSFRVRNKIFATVPPEGDRLHVFVDEDDTLAYVAETPAAFEELWWGKQLSGVRVILAAAPDEVVREMLKEAWRRKAPKKLAAELL